MESGLADVSAHELSAPVVSPEIAAPSMEEPPSTTVAWPIPNRAWLRLAYIFEFWIALLVIFTVWSQVGGQGHLDLIAWYIKLLCSVSLAWSAVKMTHAMVENARAWNHSTVRWFLAVVAISAVIAGITYWYHLHEVTDEPESDENTAATTIDRLPTPTPICFRGLMGSDREHC